jgi:hypothetical protein
LVEVAVVIVVTLSPAMAGDWSPRAQRACRDMAAMRRKIRISQATHIKVYVNGHSFSLPCNLCQQYQVSPFPAFHRKFCISHTYSHLEHYAFVPT